MKSWREPYSATTGGPSSWSHKEKAAGNGLLSWDAGEGASLQQWSYWKGLGATQLLPPPESVSAYPVQPVKCSESNI